MAKKYIPAHHVVTCDVCGDQETEAEDRSEGWDSHFVPSHFVIVINNHKKDLCSKCYKKIVKVTDGLE